MNNCSTYFTFFHKYKQLTLAFCFISGYLCGCFCAFFASPSLLPIVCYVPMSESSPLGLVIAAIAPLLIVSLLVHFGCSWFLFIICFFKAFSWSLCSSLFLLAFGTAGWLMHLVYFFSSSFSIFLLCWFSLHHLTSTTSSLKKNWMFISILTFLVLCFDYCILSPAMASLVLNS